MKILVLVEKTLPIKVASAFYAYLTALRVEGYEVDLRFVDYSTKPGAHVPIAQEITWPFCRSNGPDCYVLTVGRVPMPRSGYAFNPDGHPGSSGAYACPMYYVCPEGEWTDLMDNTGYQPRKPLLNVPGDSKFDQESGPGSPGVGPLMGRIGMLNLSRLKPATFGSKLDVTEFTIQAYCNYFERNIAYREGRIVPKTLVGSGTYNGRELGGIRDWATANLSADQYQFNRTLETVEAGAPYAVVVDFKLLERHWAVRPPTPFCTLLLSYGSYQVDEETSQMNLPLCNAALAVANMGLNYDVGSILGGTVGDGWFKTANRTQRGGTIMALYGDPTLKLPRVLR